MTQTNKKVKNAQESSIDGVKLKSLLEKSIYRYLRDQNMDFNYECNTFVLQQGFKPTKPFYRKIKGVMSMDLVKVRDMTYTPDFIVTLPNNKRLIIEAKGFKTDSYKIKIKLFRRLMEEVFDRNTFFAEVNSLSELKQVINSISND